MWDSNNVFKRADYSTFILTNKNMYNLSIGGFSSEPSWRVQDSFSYHNGAPFSTYDRKNTSDPTNCPYIFSSAGW